MTDESTPWMRLLRELFGDDAEAALEEMKRMGVDPDQLAATSGLAANPAMMDHVLRQMRALVTQSDGEDVNWKLAHDVARGVAAQGGDPTVTAAQANAHRAAVSRAELWLDAVTSFDPARLQPRVWSRAEWVEATLPTWKTLAGPVAVSVSKALSGILGDAPLPDDLPGDLPGGLPEGLDAPGGFDPRALLRTVSPTVCGMHMGQAAGEMARQAFGGTDLGIPLLSEPRVALLPRAVAEFAEGLEIDEDDVRSYLALREAAHVRLFGAAPWLPGQLHALIGRYASGITIDLEALEEAVRDAGFGDPEKLQQALNRGIFASHHTDEQKETLERIETLLALIEGWVDDVTVRAAAPHLPQIGPMREMMRRRRAAGGPAEDTFANLLDLELRPRRMRDASALWAALAAQAGPEDRDAVWSHPDLLPTSQDLDDWRGWVDRRVAGEPADDVDRELERLLRGDAPDES
ncbi:zinc-dependent metalloprotease [Demequina pelophila]|uniref:zinc-dependent metalloprotease n=1 Tax=Demequina pelophila TaxID=1638984 RepID=UPI000A754664|nr:zinc-dependent metalloprotease [Demequina pelophila]